MEGFHLVLKQSAPEDKPQPTFFDVKEYGGVRFMAMAQARFPNIPELFGTGPSLLVQFPNQQTSRDIPAADRHCSRRA